MFPRRSLRLAVLLIILIVPHIHGQRGQWSSRGTRGTGRLSLSALDTLSSNDLASLLQRAEMRELRSAKRAGSSRFSSLLDGPSSMPSLRGMRSSSLSSLRDRYLDSGIGSLGLDSRRLDGGLGSSYLFDRYDILGGGSRGSMRAAQRDFFVGGGSGVSASGRRSGLAELASAGRRGDLNIFGGQQSPGLPGPAPPIMGGSSGFNQFPNFGQSIGSPSFMGSGQQQIVPQQPQVTIQQPQMQQPQVQTPQIVIQTQPQQQPAQIMSPIASTTSFSGSLPVQTVVQSLPVQFQHVQQVPINTVVQPTSFVLQQTPVVGMAAQPQTTTILQAVSPQVVHQPAPSPAVAPTNGGNSGFMRMSGMGSGLGSRAPSPFSGMAPVIVKIEDMFPQSQHPTGGDSNTGGGQEGAGGSKGITMGYNGDPNLSVMKLDEGLQVVINHSDPQKRIVNFPTPTNEAEAKVLKKILEKAEAPDFIRELVQIEPMMMGTSGMPNPTAAAAAAAATANAAAAAGIAQQQQAAAMNAAANAAATQAAAANTAAVMNAAAQAVAAAGGAGPVAPVAGAAVVAPQVAVVPPVAVAPPVGVPAAATPGMIIDRSDMPIDEILSGLYAAQPLPGPGPGPGPASASFPMAGNQPRGNSRFVLTALDMELTPQQFAELHPSAGVAGHGFTRVKRKALVNPRARWSGGVVPFDLNPGDFSGAEQQRIMAAMNQWSATTCIRFRPATPSDTNKLVLRAGRGCSSNVGMIGGVQYLTLQRECRIPKILLHELGHAIGLIHEHQREDRDNFLKIHYSNIKPGGVKDFDLFKRGSVEHGFAHYDYMSIMHYGKSAFSRDGKSITMQAVDPKFTNVMGTASTLSQSDITTVNSMYSCGGGMSSMGGMGGAMAAMGALAGMMPLPTDTVSPGAMGGAGLSMPAAPGAAVDRGSGGTIVTAPMVMPSAAAGGPGATIVTQPMVVPPVGGAAAAAGGAIITPPMIVPQAAQGSGNTIVTAPMVVAPAAPNSVVTATGGGAPSIVSGGGAPPMVTGGGARAPSIVTVGGPSMVTGGGAPPIVTGGGPRAPSIVPGGGAPPIVNGGGATNLVTGAGGPSIVTGAGGQQMVPQPGSQVGPPRGQPQIAVQVGGGQPGNTIATQAQKQQLGAKIGQQQRVNQIGNRGNIRVNQQTAGQQQMGQGQMVRNQNNQPMSAVTASGGSAFGGQGNFGQGYQIQSGNVGPSQLQQMVATSAQQGRGAQVVRG